MATFRLERTAGEASINWRAMSFTAETEPRHGAPVLTSVNGRFESASQSRTAVCE
jgi:hypothetical protein